MQTSGRALRARPRAATLVDEADDRTVLSEREIDLWSDTVGDALGQLGLFLVLAVTFRFIIGLLADLTAALR